jgi:hypothetical protein
MRVRGHHGRSESSQSNVGPSGINASSSANGSSVSVMSAAARVVAASNPASGPMALRVSSVNAAGWQ